MITKRHGIKAGQVEHGGIDSGTKKRKVIGTRNGITGMQSGDIKPSRGGFGTELLDERCDARKATIFHANGGNVDVNRRCDSCRPHGAGQVEIEFIDVTVMIVDVDNGKVGRELSCNDGNSMVAQSNSSEKEVEELHGKYMFVPMRSCTLSAESTRFVTKDLVCV